jgi:hypothetical protein
MWAKCARVVVLGILAGSFLVSDPGPVGAIQGGNYASDMAPSVARVNYNGIEACTGSVVGDRWILTAYHCLTSAGGNWHGLSVKIWQDGKVNGAGALYSSSLASAPLSMAGATAPGGGTIGNRDVILLRTSLAMPTWVKTVPMALGWPAIGVGLTEYGYGRTVQSGRTATSLQKTPDGDLRRISCSSIGSADWKSGDICAKGTTSTAWRGDSGGPLLWWVNGYWQQVGDFSIFPNNTSAVHWQGYWAESDTATRNWIVSNVRPAVATNTILHHPSGIAWLYGGDGYRHYIPTSDVLNCLRAQGAGYADTWALRTIETIPDKVGNWATCTSPSSTPTISLSQGAAAPAGSWYSVALTGFAPGVQVPVTCRDSVDPGGFYNQTFTTDAAGNASDSTLCYSGDGPDHWVTGGGVESNHVSWSGSGPPPPPPPQTWTETVGGNAHTWTNYTNAGGAQGATIPAFTSVQISCAIEGFRVADGNTWWYRIASSPWNNTYYVSADAFYNNGATSGSLSGTPFVDPAVAHC